MGCSCEVGHLDCMLLRLWVKNEIKHGWNEVSKKKTSTGAVGCLLDVGAQREGGYNVIYQVKG